MINRRSLVKTGGAASALAILGAPSIVRAAEPVKVGVLLSLSGPTAPFGTAERDNIMVLAEKYNSEGGVAGHKLDLVYHDDQSNPTEAARGATRLIRQEQAKAILGAATGSGVLAMAPICAQAKVPMFAPVATQSVTDKSHPFFPWVFRTCPKSSVSIAGIMEKAVFKPNIKKVALMYQEDAYGKDESELAKKMIADHGQGITVVESVSAPLTATDLSPAATRIRNAEPDIVLLLVSAPALGGAFVRGAEQAGLKAPIIGSLSINQVAFVRGAGKAGEGVMSVTLGNVDEPSEKQAELLKLLKAAGKEPIGYADLIGSSAIVVFAEALRRVKGEVTGQAIRDAAETICDFTGTYADGKLCYSKDDHDGFGPDTVNVVKIVNGKWHNVNI